jgi:hypothetical protein
MNKTFFMKLKSIAAQIRESLVVTQLSVVL